MGVQSAVLPVRFSLVHSAPIKNSLLGERLRNHNRYLQYSNQLGPCHSYDFTGDRETGDEDF
jgi:hypothetical protein